MVIIKRLQELRDAAPHRIKKFKMASRLTYISDLWNGVSPIKGEPARLPIRNIKKLASEIKKAEVKGYLRVKKKKTKTISNADTLQIRWYLSRASQLGLISKEEYQTVKGNKS